MRAADGLGDTVRTQIKAQTMPHFPGHERPVETTQVRSAPRTNTEQQRDVNRELGTERRRSHPTKPKGHQTCIATIASIVIPSGYC